MLGIGSGSFDPETLVVLETAFDEAWITLKSNCNANIRPNELARRICHLAMEGERDSMTLSCVSGVLFESILRQNDPQNSSHADKTHSGHRRDRNLAVQRAPRRPGAG